MIEDQRLNSTRTDVLVYSTDVLEEDVTIAGPIMANLFVSSTGTDADFFVKLIDVYPGDAKDPEPNPKGVKMGNYQMLVGNEVMRAKYRNDFELPEPLKFNTVTPISFNIWDKFHTFKKGHRIMVQVHSSWFPAYDRNPQQFMDIYQAEAKDYQKATQKIHRSKNAFSHLVLPVISDFSSQ
jgi:putative CocE/NonD family hydrolase